MGVENMTLSSTKFSFNRGIMFDMKYTPILCLLLLVPMDASNLEVIEFPGNWGNWGKEEFCPDGDYVFGIRLKVEPHRRSFDDTALNGIELECRHLYSTATTKTIHSSVGPWGNWYGWEKCSSSDGPVRGFQVRFENHHSHLDDTALNEVKMECNNGKWLAPYSPTHYGDWKPILRCPSGTAAIGVETRLEPHQSHGGDDTALNGIRLFCQKI